MRKTEFRRLSGGAPPGGESTANTVASNVTALVSDGTCAIAAGAGATYRDTAFTVASSAVMTHSLPAQPGRSFFSTLPVTPWWQHGMEHIVVAAYSGNAKRIAKKISAAAPAESRRWRLIALTETRYRVSRFRTIVAAHISA